MIAILGDVHSDIVGVQEFIKLNPNIDKIMSVGDLALWKTSFDAQQDIKAYKHTKTQIESYIANPIPLDRVMYSLKGNHDDYKYMYSSWFLDKNIKYLQQGEILNIDNTQIASLGGIFSDVRTKKHSSELYGREQRFFTKEEINGLINIYKERSPDILLTHQAASEFLPKGIFHKDEGNPLLEKMVSSINPKLYIHGHHHRNYTAEHDGIAVIGLGNFSVNKESYILYDTKNKEVVKIGFLNGHILKDNTKV